jgi:hypothetical protein
MRGSSRLAGISAAVVLAIGVAGCGSSSSSGGDGGGVVPSFPDWAGGPDRSYGPMEAWPSAMPADIPPLSGHMNMIMKRGESGGSYSVRMFFDGVSDGQFEAYVATLRKAGYSLKGEVYYTPPETEKEAEARAARGDYDVWVATLSPRELTLSIPNGSGQVTVDLDGLTQAESDALPDDEDLIKARIGTPTPAPAMSWPPEWTDRVPAPDGCNLGANNNMQSTPTDLWVACGYPDADPAHHQAIDDAYKAKLLAAGFTTQSGGPPTTTMTVYEKDSLHVVLMTGSDDWLTISVTAR